ncbi:TIGR01459 family HAD-type hydrolase [Oceanicella sp. SM1341]|uniref:TIGR01459 family HAD-type hydrolase n=1 Tax=Oceanicella sp. SM1341 TaxID=1548889 RepID=UPI000E477106|nr:TIGR01459 family HAD-type hydrolase [Oceanicella sp. SM1341]
MTQIITSLDEIAGRYDALFCDLWGCLHNGITTYPAAVEALRRFKARGGTVLLLTNSPRPRRSVHGQLDAVGTPMDVRDDIVSSGDAAQAAMLSGAFGTRVFHLGPERDISFFTEPGRDLPHTEIARVPLSQAEGIVCTGLFNDETESPDDYADMIAEGVARGLKLLCANPDVFVDRGERRIWCAGGIAAAYTAAGGTSCYFGKPHAPIYDLARQRLFAAAGREIADERILCVGDGIHTDVRGGVDQGLDTLFITGGLAAPEMGSDVENPDPELLYSYLDAHDLDPEYSIGRLR